MLHMAVGLAILGLLTAALFQLRGLLLAVCLLFLVTIAVAITWGYGFLLTLFAVLVAQSVFQASYFVGLAALSSFHRLLERRPSGDRSPGGARINGLPSSLITDLDCPNSQPPAARDLCGRVRSTIGGEQAVTIAIFQEDRHATR